MARRLRLRDLVTVGRGTTVLLGVLAVLIIGLGLRYVVRAPPHRLVIATDAPDGNFTKLARAYGERLAAQGVTLDIVTTHGSLDNLARINAPGTTVDVAFVHGGLTDAKRSPQLESLGSVAFDPLWVVYGSALGELDGFPALRGRRIGIGREGSGTEAIARRILDACGVNASNSTLLTDDGDPETAGRALAAGTLDAAVVMDPPEDAKIRALFAQPGLTLMNLSDAQGLSRNLSFLHAMVVPKSTVDLARQKPDRDLSTVASTTTLVVRKDVHPALVYLLMSVVDEVHEPPSLLHKENEFPSDKDTDLPLSPEAESYYRSGKPFLQRYLPFGLASLLERLFKVAVPVLLLVLPFLRALPAFYQWRVKRRLAGVYRQLLEVERAVHTPGETRTPEEFDESLRAIERRLRAEHIPIMYSNELYILREHIDLARRQIANAIAARDSKTEP
jgi:TRAP transporter TAXI family solute receptor